MTFITVDPVSGMEEGETETTGKERGKKAGAKEISKDGENELTKDGKTNSDQEKTMMKKRKSRKKILELGSADSLDVPMVTVEHATPSPHPPARMPDENNNEEDIEEDDDDDEDDSDEDGEEEEVEEEEVDTEMTPEAKMEMYEAVKNGDIETLEEFMDKPNADINMIWYKENLLMAAIRHGHQEMAEFLLDNGVDHTYSTSVVALKDTPKGKRFDRYEINCRQMAYDKELLDIVELIDLLQGKLWPFIRPPDRVPRLKRQKPPTSSESEDSFSSSSSGDDDDDDDVSSGGSESDTEGSENESMNKIKRKKKKKKKEKKGEEDGVGVPDDGDKENGDDTTIAAASSTAEAESWLHGEESEGENLRKKDKRKKKKKERRRKKKKKREEDEDGHDGTEGEKDKTGTGSGFDVDSGHHSMASSKLKIAMLREHDRLSELEERAAGLSTERPALSSEGGLFPPKDRAEEKSLKDLTITHSERSEAEGTHIPDEGYGSISMKSQTPCISPEMKPSWSLPPTNRIRSTKAALAVWQVNKSRLVPSPDYQQGYTRDRPLRWRKVSTVGSYAKESRQWHVDQSANAEEEASVQISEIKLSLPTSAATSTLSSSMLSSSSSSLPKSILKPGTPYSASASVSEKPQSPGLKSKTPPPKTAAKSDKVAGYMRPTKSTMTKKRLSPNFVTSYGALDFQYIPETKLSQHFVSATTPTASFDTRQSYSPSQISSKTYGMANIAGSTSVQKRNHSSISFRS